MASPNRDNSLALAGIYQSVSMVKQVARTGMVEIQPFAASINSIFTLDAESTEDVFDGVSGVGYGIDLLLRELKGESRQKDTELMGYSIGLIHLEKKLGRQPKMLQQIQEGIEAAKEQTDHFPPTHDNIIARLADLYANTISALGPRIMVNGEPVHLNNPNNANRIRALLLAGIRSTVLWRQKGGSRLSLLLSRRNIVENLEALAASIR